MYMVYTRSSCVHTKNRIPEKRNVDVELVEHVEKGIQKTISNYTPCFLVFIEYTTYVCVYDFAEKVVFPLLMKKNQASVRLVISDE